MFVPFCCCFANSLQFSSWTVKCTKLLHFNFQEKTWKNITLDSDWMYHFSFHSWKPLFTPLTFRLELICTWNLQHSFSLSISHSVYYKISYLFVCLCVFTAVAEDDETVSWAIRACQRCLIYLGDIGKSANIWISSKISFMFKSKSKLIVHVPVTRIFWK